MNPFDSLNIKNHPLEHYTTAVVDDHPRSDRVEAAQRRLETRLGNARERNRPRVAAWGLATAALLAVALLPLLIMPGNNAGLAFAEVQSWFSDFRTLRARLTTQLDGSTVSAMDIRVDAQGRTRLDSGEAFSFVIDPGRDAMLQLFHDRRVAVRVPLPSDGDGVPGQTLDWLDELREYQGKARLLEETRTIDGTEVFGFRLSGRAQDMTLWASESGRPVLFEMETGAAVSAVTTRIRFWFDEPLEAERFSLSVPAGYELADPDPDD